MHSTCIDHRSQRRVYEEFAVTLMRVHCPDRAAEAANLAVAAVLRSEQFSLLS